ncbi:MAG: ATP-dependent sacrificial sulfur transferase LarE [Clostridia bacterium]|nr:ATP-dependent sacrificial sulfur transferase LarE [Clostridia bacterium]
MNKIETLKNILSSYKKVCIAYSGGTDSDFLLNMAKKVLNENVIAIIGDGRMVARKDIAEAVRLAEKAGVKYYVIKCDAFSVEQFRMNRHDRCYYCKINIMGGIISKAKELGFDVVADGKNTDDAKVYRPGAKAAKELGLASPLFEAGFSKDEIRKYARQMELETWNKPSNSCLATRFPYDTELNEKLMYMVEKAEELISNFGLKGARVRLHGNIARIEIQKKDFGKFIENENLTAEIKSLGFKYVTLDCEGFRSGSMD